MTNDSVALCFKLFPLFQWQSLQNAHLQKQIMWLKKAEIEPFSTSALQNVDVYLTDLTFCYTDIFPLL